MDITITTHYDKEDVEFDGDYTSITIEIDGKEVIEYEDYYHDGRKPEGFIDCINTLEELGILKDVVVTEKDVADWEY